MTTKPSPAVYRRRRLVALGILVLVVGLIVWGVTAVAGMVTSNSETQPPHAAPTERTTPAATAGPPSTPESSPEATPEATPTPTGTPEPEACEATNVRVIARTDAESYAPDQRPKLSMTVENRGGVPCILDVGTAAQEYRVSSGNDIIWVSRHCEEDPKHQEVLLTPGKVVEAPAIEWVRERSAPDTCDSERPAAVAGGAYYKLTVTVDDISSESATFVLE